MIENKPFELEQNHLSEDLKSSSTAFRLVSGKAFSIRHSVEEDCFFEPHAHPAYAVTSIIAGEMSARIDDEQLVALPGQTLFTDIGQIHSGSAERLEFVSVHINPSAINQLIPVLGYAGNVVDNRFRERLVIDRVIASIADSIRMELASEQSGGGRMLSLLIEQLSIHLLRVHLNVRTSSRIEMSRAGPVDRRVRRAVEFMHNNYAQELSLEEIAAAAYLSEYHFARLFKQVTGITTGAYLANLRLEHARRLLAETRLSISQIGAMVGYQSQSHFTKVFKSATGVTPRVFRDNSRLLPADASTATSR